DQLPLELPAVERYEPTDTGESPLSAITEWVNTTCPTCGGPAKRETDTMPTWAGSSWYFLRYLDPQNNTALADPAKLKYWLPVDWYNGGMEHVTLHLLYSRFWYKFLWDIGAVPKECGSEPYKKRTAQGMILGEGGEKMSKSRGNVINPDEVVAEHGADTLRLYEMFMGPFDQAIPWDTKSIIGVRRFLDKVWQVGSTVSPNADTAPAVTQLLHQTIQKVTADIAAMRFNTAISALMILVNMLQKQAAISPATMETLLVILAPFAPHITEELWHQLGHIDSIHTQTWPQYDPALAQADEMEIVVQINGKRRSSFMVATGATDAAVEKLALAQEKVQAALAGQTPKKVIVVSGRLVNIVV
ncbi:MAG: class I tRNA ligase family protein, partial [Patescibacteria group bacterium]